MEVVDLIYPISKKTIEMEPYFPTNFPKSSTNHVFFHGMLCDMFVVAETEWLDIWWKIW